MKFLSELTTKERKDVFLEAEKRLGLRARAIEKDFWICWILKRIFELPEIGNNLTFKGGTSLSKGYNLIKRFSEDVDLTIDRQFLGISKEEDPINAPSRKVRDKRIKLLVSKAENIIGGSVLVSLSESIGQVLKGDWELLVDEVDKQTLLFQYPRSISSDNSLDLYIKETVRLEFGVRGDPWPTDNIEISSYANQVFQEVFLSEPAIVNTMQVVRTFWEKILILHAQANRLEGNISGERMSRHYYDIMMLTRKGIDYQALEKVDLLKSVVENKSTYFPSAWASYDTANIGELKLIPSSKAIKILEEDYKRMEAMFFEEPPTFAEMINEISELEARLNRLA